MRSIAFLRAAGLSLVLSAPLMTLAYAAPVQSNAVPGHQSELQAQAQEGFQTGNDPAQGRYYDQEDEYLDSQVGVPGSGAPVITEGGF